MKIVIKHKKVICFGEALIDFLHTETQPHERLSINAYCQFPGGAPANAAVAIAKLGGNVHFMGQVGDDAFGHFLTQSLATYGVNIDSVFKHPIAKTALAFVMRDTQGERHFSFYRDQSADLIFGVEQLPSDAFTHAGIFHFCSNTLTDDHISATTMAAIDRAKHADALISFDVNLRHSLWPQQQVELKHVNQFVAQAHVLKFAQEELDFLSKGEHQTYIENCLAQQCQLLIVTNGGAVTKYYTRTLSGMVQPSATEVIDTTAGGDGFIGGLLFLLSQLGHYHEFYQLVNNENNLDQVIRFAIASGAMAVSRLGAFPALPTFTEVKHCYPPCLSHDDVESAN